MKVRVHLYWHVLMYFLLIVPANHVHADWGIDDNVLAHRLYIQGQYSEAAEIFTDPAWKGLALYRSEQWWRAAEAFVRADDPVSAFNLGNSYVQLGYYALALEAYQRALATQPDMQAARHNAEVMRALLSTDDDAAQQAGRRDPRDEIDRLDTDNEDEPPGGGPDGNQDSTAESDTEGESGSPNDAGPSDNAGGESNDRGTEDSETREENGADPGATIAGESSTPPEASLATGSSEADEVRDDADIAGQRAKVEQDQATEQWLNQIHHDPARYLQRRIALELRRRQATGQTAPSGGNGW